LAEDVNGSLGPCVEGVMGPEPITSLFAEEYAPMVRLAHALTGDRAVAEELAQEAFARVWRKLDDLADPARAAGYLRTTVVNLTRSHHRRRRLVARRPWGTASLVDDGADRRADRDVVLRALRTIPRRQRECLTLRYLLGLSEAEVAETLGIAAGSVKTHTSRGLAAMAARLEEGR
jgi:RNA polymerase sigma-70 factor (ECF subfamily)